MMVPKQSPVDEEEAVMEGQNCEDDRLPDDTHEFETMYEKSRYYQDFLSITYKPTFETEVKPQNSFYNVEFSTMFLKKYVAILPLWTSIIVSRKSSGPVESHFKDSKSRIRHKEPEIGALPLKCGRLCRELEQHTKYVTRLCTMNVPRKNNCYTQSNKRKRDTDGHEEELSPKKLKVNDNILSLYKCAPKPKIPKASSNKSSQPKTPSHTSISTAPDYTTPSSTIAKQQTPTVTYEVTPTGPKMNQRKRKLEFDLPMDNEQVQEQWFRQKKKSTRIQGQSNIETNSNEQRRSVFPIYFGKDAQSNKHNQKRSKIQNWIDR